MDTKATEQIQTLAGRYGTLTPTEKLTLLEAIKTDLAEHRARVQAELATLNNALGTGATAEFSAPIPSGGKLSRSEAAKLRWAKRRAAQGGTGAGNPAPKTKGKRTMSPEARAKIAAAQKARWAKQKKAGK